MTTSLRRFQENAQTMYSSNSNFLHKYDFWLRLSEADLIDTPEEAATGRNYRRQINIPKRQLMPIPGKAGESLPKELWQDIEKYLDSEQSQIFK